jgi:hypothetical protein
LADHRIGPGVAARAFTGKPKNQGRDARLLRGVRRDDLEQGVAG